MRGKVIMSSNREAIRWQKRLDKHISEVYPQRDGAGCDSGDPLDVTEAEMCQAFNSQSDTITRLEAEKAELVEALARFVGWCDKHDWGTVPKHVESNVRAILAKHKK